MRKLLLSSSAASVLASALTVILCTLALFLSGYAIQQRTLRELRASLRPRELPRAPLMPVVPPPNLFYADKDEDAAAPGEGRATARQVRMMEHIRAQAQRKAWAVENPDPLIKDRAPVGRAQRRRMIKDEIQRLARAEQQPVSYQRRLW